MPPQEGTEPFSAREPSPSTSMGLKFRVKVQQEKDGLWYADCLDFQGCHTFGETRAEAMQNILAVISDRLHGELGRAAEAKSWSTGPDFETVEIAA
jgi:hypothetical protein